MVRAYARVAARALASSLMNVDLCFLHFSLSHLPEAVRSTLGGTASGSGRGSGTHKPLKDAVRRSLPSDFSPSPEA